ncbi:hypothetical protein [Rhizobium lentis]|uniref:hypothetical protein n=1 Tax=Rhizobium lentis TaxID=1138194 RepID=UPI001C835C21|nr:hypothetical protein [Rhizobium lentis]MBX4954743.1 hypothetical protein [Rhizobium lentis]MBX5034538.1 hypothetical protein [Rhizobium lentis]
MAKKIITNDKGNTRYVLRDSDGRFKETKIHREGHAFGFVERVVVGPKSGGTYRIVERSGKAMPRHKPSKKEYEPKLARPVEKKADPKSFAADLLKTDSIILDYLAK